MGKSNFIFYNAYSGYDVFKVNLKKKLTIELKS